MASTLFRTYIILIVLCIVMTLIHNSQGGDNVKKIAWEPSGDDVKEQTWAPISFNPDGDIKVEKNVQEKVHLDHNGEVYGVKKTLKTDWEKVSFNCFNGKFDVKKKAGDDVNAQTLEKDWVYMFRFPDGPGSDTRWEYLILYNNSTGQYDVNKIVLEKVSLQSNGDLVIRKFALEKDWANISFNSNGQYDVKKKGKFSSMQSGKFSSMQSAV